MSAFWITTLYGVALTVAALIVARTLYAQSWPRLAFIALAIVGYVVIGIGLIQGLFEVPAWFAPFLEEPLKLAIIAALYATRRLPVAICLAFAGVEVIDKAFLSLSWPPISLALMIVWLTLLTGPVLMHCATGLIYSERGSWPTAWLLGGAIALHVANNLVAGGAATPTALTATAIFTLVLGLGELIAVFGLTDWLRSRPARVPRG